MKVLTEDKVHDDFAVIVELTDEELAILENDPALVEDKVLMTKLIQSKGSNAHILQLTLKNPFWTTIRHFSTLFTQYKSISWVREGKFYIRRIK